MSPAESRGESALEVALERLLGEVLRTQDPAASLESQRTSLTDRLGAYVDTISADGLRMTALLVVKLRFERVLAASSRAGRLFQDDPSRFADLFRSYHAGVPAASPMPADEGAAFEAWLDQHGGHPA